MGGKLSAVLVAAGSSVGLGNIWRFPYVAGDNGGGAFLIIYILCVLLLGLPLMIAEFTVGRASHRNAVGAYRALNPRWSFLGYNGVLAAFLILGFYFVVSGWTAEYMVHSVTGSIARFSTAEQYKSLFENFISNPWRPVVYTCLFVLATHFVIAMGVQKGTKRSAKILMPRCSWFNDRTVGTFTADAGRGSRVEVPLRPRLLEGDAHDRARRTGAGVLLAFDRASARW